MLAAAQRQLNRLHAGSLLIDGRISPQRRRLSVSRHVCGAGKQQQQQQPSGEGGKPLARSIRAMPIRIISVSKGTPASNAYVDEWLDKLRRYAPAEVVQVKPNPLKARDVDVAKAAEAQKVLALLSPRDRVVALDERGREVSSEDVARLLAAAGDDGVPLAFCIGGPFGHGPGVLERADDRLRLSKLVLNHSVALAVLVEQLYRGHTILEGSPYHH
ncbi:hypothetical protein Rsub_06666 [Raphidocelis subcapitata]|uniref:RNA methyltransferase n=1 Tax=Raphidocelis subcapitata TaxID=307507 RepID=A0A2V0P3V0_9CHLO|nr:hypothetical protein Rsub_06666 [Raphidocelis subcapitata]|eukprot:GBF94551.1 hypothetical protein Rsub_06666 [Raphidocelis subcapitata]